MADVNTGRKRKSSPQEMIIDLLDDEESSEKVAEIIAERDCKEPLTKCPRKSESPTPNLNAQAPEDEVILLTETEAHDKSTCLADVGEDVICLESSQEECSQEEDEDTHILDEDAIAQCEVDKDVICLDGSQPEVIAQSELGQTDVICIGDSQPDELEISQLIVISECSSTTYEEKIDECDNVKVNPVITIDFANDSIIEKYKVKFLEFIANFTELNAIDENNKISVVVTGSSEDANKKRRKDKKKIRAKKELFTLDTCPTVDTEVAPKYNSKFKVVEHEGDEEKEDTSCKQQSCFNCEGNHSLRDCPLPKDFNKIRIARQNFRSNQSKSSKRYHLEPDQLYGHLKPGRISDKLRSALGLHTHDIPSHVYKMRILGYPPGWLEEAKITSSNIAMFDIDGKSVKGKDAGGKPIDPEKIIGYPGFNVDLEEGCHDDHRLYNAPPYSRTQSKEAMISYINKMVESMQDNLETCDMEIDASSDKEVPPGCESETSQEGQDRVSPSLTELEKKKNELLAALTGANPDQDETKDANKPVTDKSNGTNVAIEDKGDVTLENLDISMEASTPKLVKTSAFGTPILKSCSPFSRLPDADAFMKDVSPVINFENLPNSTGKYEQMTNVLERVRTTLKNIQDKT